MLLPEYFCIDHYILVQFDESSVLLQHSVGKDIVGAENIENKRQEQRPMSLGEVAKAD